MVIEDAIVPGHFEDQPLFQLWVGGVFRKKLYMKDVLGDREPLKTASHYAWGEPLGFDGNSRFILRLLDGSMFTIPLS